MLPNCYYYFIHSITRYNFSFQCSLFLTVKIFIVSKQKNCQILWAGGDPGMIERLEYPLNRPAFAQSWNRTVLIVIGLLDLGTQELSQRTTTPVCSKA